MHMLGMPLWWCIYQDLTSMEALQHIIYQLCLSQGHAAAGMLPLGPVGRCSICHVRVL